MNRHRAELDEILRLPAHRNGGDEPKPLFDPLAARFGRFLESAPAERRMIVPGLLPLDIVGLLASTGGTGKSLLLYALGISTASGSPFLGHQMAEVGGVLYLAAEDDEQELHRRGLRLLEHARESGWVDRSALAERLHVVSRVAEINLLTAGREGEVVRTPLVDRLVATAKQIPDLKLILIDPVSRFRGGRANSEEDATAFVTALETLRAETGATVLAAVHVNKSSAREGGEADQSAVRGSSALVDGVRWSAHMQRMRRDEAADYGLKPEDAWSYVRLDLPKSNYTAPWPGMWLHRLPGGVLVPVELEHRTEAKQEARADARYSDVLTRLQELLRREGPLTRNRIERDYAGASGVLAAGEKNVRAIISRAVAEGDLVEAQDPDSSRGRIISVPPGAL